MTTSPNSKNNETDFGVLPTPTPVDLGIETISAEDRAEYEAAVDAVLQNDRDLDGDVDIKDKLLGKLDDIEGGLRRMAEGDGVINKLAGKAADIVDKFDGSGHEKDS